MDCNAVIHTDLTSDDVPSSRLIRDMGDGVILKNTWNISRRNKIKEADSVNWYNHWKRKETLRERLQQKIKNKHSTQ